MISSVDKPAMHQNLVDHHLKEQRRDQREYLQEERRDQHLDQQTAVFVHRLQEPGHVEPPRQLAKPGAAGHQDQLAAPFRLERLAAQGLHLAGDGFVDQNRGLGEFAENEETAVPACGNRRKRGFTKTFPIAVDGARLEFQFLGTTQNLFNPELAAIAVHQLFGIGGNAQKPQDQHETGQAGARCFAFSFGCR